MEQEAFQARSTPRILEIGDGSRMLASFPETTEFHSTYDQAESDPAIGRYDVSLATLPRLAHRIASRSFDLIVVHVPQHSPWSIRGVGRSLFRRSTLQGRFHYFQTMAQQLVRLASRKVPIAVLDFDDPPVIFRHNLFLLDRATVYFKRELPTDHWRLFMGTVHPRVPTPRFRAVPRNQNRLEKIRPISLGLPLNLDIDRAPPPESPKSVDVFFSGRINGSASIRRRGLDELLALRAKGVKVDIPEHALPRNEYLKRCARSYLVWCPEGFGWDCFRTYEAALSGSVPLPSRQTIDRHMPLLDGIHALYYDVEPGELGRVIERAVLDRPRLLRVAIAARTHVLAHHTPAAIGRYIAETTLDVHRQRRAGQKPA